MPGEVEPPPGWWAIVELTDHRRVAGLLSEQVVAGTSFLRIDVPANASDGTQRTTQLYAPHAVYSITPVDEHVAVRVAGRARQAFGEAPVTPTGNQPPSHETAPRETVTRELTTRAAAGESAAGGHQFGESVTGQHPTGRPGSSGSTPDEDRELLTVSELASRYSCSRSTVMRWQTFDDFPEPAVRGPRRLAVYEFADVEHFLAQHPELLRAYHRG